MFVSMTRSNHSEHSKESIPGVGKLFAPRARFGKTVEAAGRTLIEKQGEDLFL